LGYISVQLAFKQTKVSAQLVGAVHAQLLELFGDEWEQKRFAVRSSAVGEDGDETSSAGQNETFLGVRGLEQVCNSSKCHDNLACLELKPNLSVAQNTKQHSN
jgi:phosphoenolpyruvate synthase/pyruvate phosphate dikinase